MKFKDDELLTLVAIRMLNDVYYDNKKIWKLVEKKARKFLLQSMATPNAQDLNVAISNVVTCFKSFEN